MTHPFLWEKGAVFSLVFVFVFALFLSQAPSASATTCVFASAGDSDYNNAANWLTCDGAIPDNADTAQIPAATTTNLTAAIAAAAGPLSLEVAGTFNTGNFDFETKAVNPTGISVSSGGTIALGTASVTTTGNFTVVAGGTITQSAAGVLAVGGNLTVGASTHTLAGEVRLLGGYGYRTVVGGVFNKLQYAGGATDVLDFTASTTIMGHASTTALGNIQYSGPNGGSLSFYDVTEFVGGSVSSSNGGSLAFVGAVTSTATINAGSGTSTFSSTLTNNATVTSTSGTLAFSGAITNTATHNIGTASGKITFASTFTNAGTFDLGPSALATSTGHLVNSGTLNLNGSSLFTLAGNYTNTGTQTANGGTVRFAGGSAQILTAPATSGNFYSIEVFKSANGLTLASAVTSTGNFTLTAGTFTPATYIYSVQGNWSHTAGTFTPSTGTIRFNGANAQTVTAAATNGDFGNIQINKSAESLTLGSAVTSTLLTTLTAGNLNLGSYTLALTDAGTATTPFVVTSGVLVPATGKVVYDTDAATSIAAVSYYELAVRGAQTFTITASTTAMATTTVATGATLAMGAQTFYANGDIVNDGTITQTTGVFHHLTDYVRFTDSASAEITTLAAGGSLYVTLRDQNRNLLSATAETVTVRISVGLDSENVTLTETGLSTGIFRNATALTLTQIGSAVPGNGTVEVVSTGTGTASYVDAQEAADTSSGTVSMTVTTVTGGGATTAPGSSGGGGGTTTVTPVFVAPPAVSTVPVSVANPSPVAVSVATPWSLTGTPGPATVALVNADYRAFGVMADAVSAAKMALFIEQGISSATVKLGSGERRALVRDALDTMQRASIPLDDLERLATGAIPMTRNLASERARVNWALPTFRSIYGHAPVFSNPEENLAWNTLMYRIRFTRDLVKERKGIQEFRRIFKRDPSTPATWAVVRVLGYVK